MLNQNDNSLYIFLIRTFVLTFSYVAVGRVCLFLAVPSVHATTIFIPAGIGLAAILLWGKKYLFSVFLGSLSLSALIFIEQEQVTYFNFFVSSLLAMGATLQAFVALKIIHKVIGTSTSLTKDRDILFFLLLSGPVCCLINASISVTTLFWAGVVNQEYFFQNWITWWVGDSIGAMIAVPLMFVAFAKPRALWKERLYIVAVPLLVLLSIVIGLFNWVSDWEKERNQYEFNEIARDNVAKLQASFISYIDAVAAIERFYSSSTQSDIKRSEFKSFVKYTLENKPGINGLSWNPVIKSDQRDAFENTIQNEGFSSFRITERNANSEVIPANERNEYIVVKYIEPLEKNKKAHGFDVASNSARRQALNTSKDNAKAFATAKITLVQEQGEQAGFLLFYPVYKGKYDTLEQRRKNIKGFAVGVFRVGDITDTVIDSETKQDVVVGIYDQTEGKNTHLYGPNNIEMYNKQPYTISKTIIVGGRTWNIVFWPTDKYISSHSIWQAWAALISGLTFTCIIGAFLLAMSGRSNQLNSEVKARTLKIEEHKKEIENTNHMLAQRNQQLERSNQELDQYAFVASHDLKSPLQAIEKLASWINEDCQEILPEASREHLNLLNQRVKRMKSLLADLLMFARISREKYIFEQIDLSQLVQNAVSFNCISDKFEVEIRNCEKNIMSLTIPLEIAVRNVLNNAIKHHNKNTGKIIVEYLEKNNMHVLSISDDGPGIPIHLQQVSVEMFQTLKSRDEVEGSGLGLSIVNKAMERMDGYLNVISDGISGTKVELYWSM